MRSPHGVHVDSLWTPWKPVGECKVLRYGISCNQFKRITAYLKILLPRIYTNYKYIQLLHTKYNVNCGVWAHKWVFLISKGCCAKSIKCACMHSILIWQGVACPHNKDSPINIQCWIILMDHPSFTGSLAEEILYKMNKVVNATNMLTYQGYCKIYPNKVYGTSCCVTSQMLSIYSKTHSKSWPYSRSLFTCIGQCHTLEMFP